ncbi:MAG: DHA2 family efflux MFS transporter permease subunit [Sphingomonadales bacterium]|nr:DHA2 family efflux MFS transporter permease subunit [Sphingomonadales bacterium]
MSAADPIARNRGAITFGIILTTLMSALDTTVANIALPHIQGSLSASPEQITWVITSYIVATAVTIPVSGWLSSHFGLKPMLIACIAGFTLTSLACGLATSLPELVLFRIAQGVIAAPLMPVTQAVLLNINPPERHGRAMALFTMAAVLAPAVGPIIGGWLTEALSWRWCFFINLPAGVLSIVILATVLPASPPRPGRFDFLGFGALGLAIGCLQLVLDRGTTLDWFDSREIVIEATLSATAFAVYLIHSMTSPAPLFPLAIFRDRNLVTASVFGFLFSILTFTSFTLLPLMMQGLLGYSVIHAGWLSVPRGLLMLLILQFMGRIDQLVDRRVLVAVGLFFFVLAFWEMGRFSLDMDGDTIVWATLLQGVGQGILFVPLATLGFATIAPRLRADGAAFNALMRNVGGSAGVAAMQALAARNAQAAHTRLAAHIVPGDPRVATLPDGISPPLLDGLINRQAMMLAYVQDFRLMTLIGLLCIPLVLLMRTRRQPGAR